LRVTLFRGASGRFTRKEEMVLLHAHKKQGQKLPVKERDIAIRRMKELLS